MNTVFDNNATPAAEKPLLNFWQIWNMSFGFLGIQFGWGLQMANMSSIYNYLGAKPDEIPMLWLAAPLTGLLVQPIIGYMSDRTWTGLGRRKPYFLTGAILASAALMWMPNASALWMAAGLLWVLDASINVSMEPFRAFVSDMLPEKQLTRGYTMQSVFIGLGSVIASSLPFIFTNVFHIANDGGAGVIPTSVKWSFYIGAVAFLGAVLYTIFTTREYSPDELASFEAHKKEDALHNSGISEIFSSIANMPRKMRQLALVQFFTWPGLFLMWFYFNDTLAYHIMGAPDAQSPLYQQANEWGGMCMAFKDIVTFAFAFALPGIAARLGLKTTHIVCLLAGAAGLLLMGVWTHSSLVLISMFGVGLAWASILSMPYAMLASALPKGKTGIYMGIFNFFIVIPEIIASLTFGYVMKNILHNSHVTAVMLGGVLFIIAALCTLLVRDTD